MKFSEIVYGGCSRQCEEMEKTCQELRAGSDGQFVPLPVEYAEAPLKLMGKVR
jgi:hypothetical protein